MENLQHVQLPNRKENEDISPQEQLVYLSIKRWQDKITKEARPSLKKLSEVTGASINTVRKYIDLLVEKDYITIRKLGKQNIYSFNPYKEFEPFSYSFLDNSELSFLEKSFLIASQQFMFKCKGEGSISYTDSELADKIQLSKSSIYRCNKSLEAKGYLTIVENECRDLESGCHTTTKIYHLNKFGQAIVFLLKNHEDRIIDNSEDINELKKTIAQMQKTIDLQNRKLTKLENKEKFNWTIPR